MYFGRRNKGIVKAVGARRAVCNGSQTRQACGYNMAYEKILHRAKVPPICTSISPQKSKPYSYKGGKTGRVQLKMLEPLYVYDENGNYSKEIDNIYGREVRNIE